MAGSSYIVMASISLLTGTVIMAAPATCPSSTVPSAFFFGIAVFYRAGCFLTESGRADVFFKKGIGVDVFLKNGIGVDVF